MDSIPQTTNLENLEIIETLDLISFHVLMRIVSTLPINTLDVF